MRTFEQFPAQSKCPICGTSENTECVIVNIYGTQKDGIIEAHPFHLKCIELYWVSNYLGKKIDVLVQAFQGKS